MPSGVLPLQVVWQMLDACAPGHTRQEHDHWWDVLWREHRFPRLPLGGHGRKRRTGRAEVELGHVRQLVRYFNIVECAIRYIPKLRH